MWPRRPASPEPPLDGAHGRVAAVLILVYPIASVLHLVLTRRTETVQNHKGQISLPGGAHEGQESLEETALREAREELAIATGGLELLGRLTPLYVGVSDYTITPVVAMTARRPRFRPDPVEVVEAIEVPLSILLDPAARRQEDWEIRGVHARVPFFAIGPHKVWGATAMILAEFAALLETVTP
jgi:8-oxo-dGTP pyrophosphatase MutT (NUDIX family)